jgi:hypothetical protein
MQPTWHKGSTLLPCGGETGQKRVGGVAVARAGFDGNKVISWQFSVPKSALQSIIEVFSSSLSDQLHQSPKKTSILVADVGAHKTPISCTNMSNKCMK